MVSLWNVPFIRHFHLIISTNSSLVLPEALSSLEREREREREKK